jgi:hypothetical protein
MRRLGELLHSTVVDAAGRELGSVDDVRLVQDGPLLEGFGNALRVDALVIGRGSLAVRLGFHRQKMKGPWLLKTIFGALERKAVVALWAQVESWEDRRITLVCRADELQTVADAYP